MLSLIFLHKTKMKRQQNHKGAPCHIELTGKALGTRTDQTTEAAHQS